ncbi:tbc domain-containing [Trichoderma cornu-damae]|uniref:Tbc domain-containing n=1 Tax=Trichoderma cornu-damae TaxID=654480 RepID=A0A9P8TY02_9HYPO|nr:tbc domain-containing [Trichoderma cornu-damae]
MSPEKELVDTAGLHRDDVDFAEPEDPVDGSAPSPAAPSPAAPSPAAALKTSEILAACTWRDATRLRALAESDGGLLADALRRAAYADADADADADSLGDDWKDLPRHRDEDQVQLDVNRSFVHYPSDQSEPELRERKHELSNLIVEILRRHPYLCYFQGYHDICQVFLLVLEPAARVPLVARLSVLRIRDFMLPSLSATTAQLRLLPDILARADPELRRHLSSIEPFYALAGTLTMYAHNIERYADIARLFDVILAREPTFSIYLFAQIVIGRREEILEIDEPDMLQVILGRVPPELDLDALIKRAVDLFIRHPPETLGSWRRISGSSVLKTCRDVDGSAEQTLEDGHRYFEKQVKEIHWEELRIGVGRKMWQYRRPVRFIGAAVLVGVVAFYLGRNPTLLQHVWSLFPGRR